VSLRLAVCDGMTEINGGSRISYIKVDFLFRGNENAAPEIRSMDQTADLLAYFISGDLIASWRRKGRFYALLASLIAAIYCFRLTKLAASAVSSYDVYLAIRSRLERKSCKTGKMRARY